LAEHLIANNDDDAQAELMFEKTTST